MEQIETAILDADFAIKAGSARIVRVIEDIIPQFAKLIYIHRHVYNNEILTPAIVKEQLNTLMSQGRVIIVDRDYIETKVPERLNIYDETVTLLINNHAGTVQDHDNWGEVVSLAFAKSMKIPIFLSDEMHVQALIDEFLNMDEENGTAEGDIKVVRIKDFVLWMKQSRMKRKMAAVIWASANKSSSEFEKIWPPSIVK